MSFGSLSAEEISAGRKSGLDGQSRGMKALLGIQVALLLLTALGCSRMDESLVLLFLQALFYRHLAAWFRFLVVALGVYLVMR